ncbi:MAG: MoaD/ThiS family protein [Thermomicrobiales bacterium]
MQVIVNYQGIIGDMIGRKQQEVTLPEGATVADLRAELDRQGERAAAVLKQARPFVNGHLVVRETELADGANVTFMRPIGGG